jgi:hypothetical protein
LPRTYITPALLAAYKKLVDGLGPNSGMNVVSIANELGISKQAVDAKAKVLEKKGHIARIPGTRNPVLYKRGPRSNVLDTIIIDCESTVHGGTVSVNQDRLTASEPSADPHVDTPIATPSQAPAEAPTCRTHINGRVEFSVTQKGSLERMTINRPDGTKLPLDVFEPRPYLEENGVRMWKGAVPYDGDMVTVQYTESDKGTKKLFVWPKEVYLVPEQFKQAPEIFEARAQEAVNVLSKYGGWRFGLLQFKGKIEFASSDARFLAMFPSDGKWDGGSCLWLDRSPGELEGETDDAQVAYDIHAYAKATKEIRTGIAQLKDLNDRSDLLIEITGKLEIAVERVASIEATLIERGARDITGKVEIDNGVMFG